MVLSIVFFRIQPLFSFLLPFCKEVWHKMSLLLRSSVPCPLDAEHPDQDAEHTFYDLQSSSSENLKIIVAYLRARYQYGGR